MATAGDVGNQLKRVGVFSSGDLMRVVQSNYQAYSMQVVHQYHDLAATHWPRKTSDQPLVLASRRGDPVARDQRFCKESISESSRRTVELE